MADRVTEVRTFSVSTPPGTAQATPQVTNLAMPARIVERVRLRVPPGPFGTLGLALGMAGTRVIPWGADQWLVMDNETLDTTLEGQPSSGAWQLQTYNTGIYAHLVYVTFWLLPVSAAGDSGPGGPLEIGPGVVVPAV